MTTNYRKYVHNIVNQSVGSRSYYRFENNFADIMNKSGQFSDEDDITGLNSLKKTHQFNKKPMN